MNAQRDERNYGIDLLRLVAMYMVVVLHLLSHGGWMEMAPVLTANYEAAWLLKILVYGTVNCYGMISGYVMLHTEVRYRKLFPMWLQVFLYSVGIYVLFKLLGYNVSMPEIKNACFPATYNIYWYFTAYVPVFFLAPFVNKMILALKEKEIIKLFAVVVILFSFLPTMLGRDLYMMTGGFSSAWLLSLYVVGACIRRITEIYPQIRSAKWGWGYVACVVFTWGQLFIREWYSYQLTGEVARGSRFTNDYLSFPILVGSMSLLLCFSSLKINNELFINVIKKVSPLAFAIYLFHEHPMVRMYFVGGSTYGYGQLSALEAAGLVIKRAFVLCLIGIAVDAVRKLIFDLLKVNKWLERKNKNE